MGAIFNNRLFRWAVYLAMFAAAVAFWFQRAYPVCTFRYTLDAEVETPDGLRRGSSNIEVSYQIYMNFGGPTNWKRRVRGEAVYVDLGGGKNFFVTLTRENSGRGAQATYENLEGSLNPTMLPLAVLGLKLGGGGVTALCEQVVQLQGSPPKDVPFDLLPTLVTFGDLKVPNSARVIQPDALSEEFGVGFRIRRVTLALTNNEPQEQIERTLPWLPGKAIEWKDRVSVKNDDPLVKRLFYDAFKEPGLRDGEK
jgi:hypothetical protein